MSAASPEGAAERFRRQLRFLEEIDALKSILRRNRLMDGSRRENDAEHSWHLVMMAVILSDQLRDVEYDLLKVIKMVAIHDIVEIHAGDVFAYDAEGLKAKPEAEARAAERIFGLLPPDQAADLIALWKEFEDGKTVEARIAGVYDRFQPEVHNFANRGELWRENGVTAGRILDRNRDTAEAFPLVWERLQAIVRESVAKGWLGEAR